MAALAVFLQLALALSAVEAFPGCPGRSYEVKKHAGTCNYFPSGAALKYEAAKQMCRDKYGEQAAIPSILNEEDNRFYGRWASGRSWIGLVRDSDDGPWRWEDGSTSEYRNWNESNPKSGDKCAIMNDYMNRDKGKWFSAKCDGQGRKVMCKSGQVNNWRAYNDYEYFAELQAFHNTTWSAARAACMTRGGDLLSVHTQEQGRGLSQWLKESASDLGPKRLWIGLKTTDGTNWQWSDGTRPVLTFWRKNYPISTFSGAKCAVQSREGHWMNTNCGIKQNGYICKKPKGSNLPVTTPSPVEVPGHCPAGYGQVGEKCFKVVTSERQTWGDALKRCQQEEGVSPSLASIHGKMDTAYLASQLGGGEEVWVGGNRLVDRRWGWADCSTAGDFNFFSSKPRQGACMALGQKGVELGRWSADFCNHTKSFICQTHKDPNKPISTPLPQTRDCPRQYEVYNNICYRLIEQKVNWTAAYSACKRDQASLVSIESETENNAVYVQVLRLQQQSNGTVRIWIGYQDLEKTSKYTWIDGNPANFTRWTRNEPKRKVNGGCVAIREGSLYQETGVWEDKPCDRLYPAVCKYHTDSRISGSAKLGDPGSFRVSLLLTLLTLLYLRSG